MARDSIGRGEIFNDIVYYDGSSALNEQHREALENGGAVEYAGDRNEIDWSQISHAFTCDVDFPGRQEAVKQEGLAVVTVTILMVLN